MFDRDPIETFGIQSPDDVLDHTIRAGLAPNETLASPAASGAPEGLTIGAPAIAGNEMTMRISGGASNTGYVISIAAVTSFGRSLAARISLFIGPVGLDDPSIIAPLE